MGERKVYPGRPVDRAVKAICAIQFPVEKNGRTEYLWLSAHQAIRIVRLMQSLGWEPPRGHVVQD